MVSLKPSLQLASLFAALCITIQTSAQTQFTFSGGLNQPVDQPVNGIAIGADFLGDPALNYSKDGLGVSVNSVSATCKAYQDINPALGGLSVYSDVVTHAEYLGDDNEYHHDGEPVNICGTDGLDPGEALRFEFTEAVYVNALKFFRNHQAVDNSDTLLLSIDGGPAQLINLLQIQSSADLLGTTFEFRNPSESTETEGYYITGFTAESAVVVVNTGDCASDVGCTLIDRYGFHSTLPNAPTVSGTVTVRPPLKALDPRAHCTDPTQPRAPLLLSSVFPSTVSAEQEVIVPAHLCGIPTLQSNGEYLPEVWLLNVDSDLSLQEEIIFHELDDTPFAPYLCASDEGDADARFKHPVMTWIPKPGTPEVPIINANGVRSHTVRAVNIGCGSLRAGVGQNSFYPYNLHYVAGTNFINVINEEMIQLGSTVEQADVCLTSNGVKTSTLSSMVKAMQAGLQKGNYTNTVERNLDKMVAALDEDKLRGGLLNCYWDNTTDTVHGSNPEGLYVARNFRGDLKAQVLHLQYMMDAMVLVRAQAPQ